MGLWQRFGRSGFMDLVDKGGLDEKGADRAAMLVMKIIRKHSLESGLLCRLCSYFLRSFTNPSDRNTEQHRAMPALKSAKHALKSKAPFPELLPVQPNSFETTHQHIPNLYTVYMQ